MNTVNFGDAVMESLLALTRRRASATRISRNTALLIRHLLQVGRPPEGYAECTRRRSANDVHLSASEFRTALASLRHWGWIERRPSVHNASGHYRLTRAFAATVETVDETLYRAIREHLPGNTPADKKTSEPPVDADLRQALLALSLDRLMHRIFELNRFQRQHYHRAYNKGTLRNVCTILHWFLQEEARQPGEPVIISLGRLATQMDLVFRTAKRARDQLAAWGVLAQLGDVYRVNHRRLVDIIEGEHAELPSPPLRISRPRPTLTAVP